MWWILGAYVAAGVIFTLYVIDWCEFHRAPFKDKMCIVLAGLVVTVYWPFVWLIKEK